MVVETITVSTSRKINHAIYGGEQYEGSDHFVSMSASIEDGEDITEKHRELMLMCKELANTSVADEILKFQGGLDWPRFFEVIRHYRLNGSLDHQASLDAQRMNRLQQKIMNEMKLLIRKKSDHANEDIVIENINDGNG